MSVIDEVKQRTDIVEVISQYASLKKAGRNLTALCPFHSEKHPSFFVYPEQQSWHCFGACNTGGDAFSFLMKKEGIDFGESLRLLAQRAGVTIPSRIEQADRKEEKAELYQINEASAQYFCNVLLNSPAAEKARNYVTSRGFSTKTITDFQLGFSLDAWESLKQYLLETGYKEDALLTTGLLIKAEDGKTHDRFRGRLMFPIRDARGRTVGFGARVLDDSLPKYLNSPQTPLFDKSSILYGIDLAAAAIRKQNTAVIVEGYIDVITAHQNGITNVVASMGTAFSEQQAYILKRLTKNIILVLDADAAGKEAMLRAIDYENILGAEIEVVILPRGKDPDNIIREDVKIWRQLVGESLLPIVDYTFNMTTKELDLTAAKDKSLAAEHLLPIIAQINDTVRQAHYLRKLASLADIDERSLEVALRSIKFRQSRRQDRQPKPETVRRTSRPLVSDPLEEACLALLLQHPELKSNQQGLSLEYFEHSENREVFLAWQQSKDIASLKKTLDAATDEYIDTLINKSLPTTNVEPRYTEYVRRLRERHLRHLEAKRAEILAIEAESRGSAAELAKQQEQGTEVSVQLGEVFAQKTRRSQN